jgi:hypothetical protein
VIASPHTNGWIQTERLPAASNSSVTAPVTPHHVVSHEYANTLNRDDRSRDFLAGASERAGAKGKAGAPSAQRVGRLLCNT